MAQLGSASALGAEGRWFKSSHPDQGYDFQSVDLVISVSDEITVDVAEHQVVTAIRHLIKNAYDAFRMKKARETGRCINITAQMTSEGMAELVIHDNGPGVTVSVLRRAQEFKAGYTTKVNLGGTGFGLPTADKVCRSHGGSFAIESERGKGFTAIMILPVDHEEDSI